MNKINKLLIGITLMFFLGQSFASVILSCDLSSVQSLPSVSQENIHWSFHRQPTVQDNHHYHSNHKDTLVKNISLNTDCESSQHSCKCDLGTCSMYFLPIDGFSIVYNRSVHLDESPAILSTYHSSLLFRPPISA